MYDLTTKTGLIQLVQDRSAASLLPIIKQFILPGTEIHSDKWAAYWGIVDIPINPPYTHKTVNHKLHFVDPTSGTHTNNVECYWGNIKQKFKLLKGCTRDTTPSHLDEHMIWERYGKTPGEMFRWILCTLGEMSHFE